MVSLAVDKITTTGTPSDENFVKITTCPFQITSATNRVQLSHWGRVSQTYVSKLTSIGSDNGLSPGRGQAIIYTNAEILLIGPLGT